MTRIACFLALAVALTACSAAAPLLRTAQAAMEPFSFHAVGELKGEVAFNSSYLAVDASVDIVAEYHAPIALGAPPQIVWRKEFKRGSGQRAYQVVFGGEEGDSFIRIVPVSWEAARASMPYLPPTRGPEAPLPDEPSPPIRVVESKGLQ